MAWTILALLILLLATLPLIAWDSRRQTRQTRDRIEALNRDVIATLTAMTTTNAARLDALTEALSQARQTVDLVKITTESTADLVEQTRDKVGDAKITADGTAELLRDFATATSEVLNDLRVSLVPGLAEALQRVRDEEAAQHPTGAFLPGDPEAKEIERLARVAEDHWIGSDGQHRPSRRSSSGSRGSLEPAVLTRPRPSSGKR